jgi:hypothetical protein
MVEIYIGHRNLIGSLFLLCTDPLACNYDSTATIDDGSCTYPDTTATIFTNTSVYYPNNGWNAYNVSCPGCNDGWIAINISGGAPPFTFLWSNGSTSDSIYNLFAGTYSVIITDGNGCSSSISMNLTEAPLSTKEYVIQKKCLKVVTLLGIETKVKANQTLFYIYDDGTVEKRIIIE